MKLTLRELFLLVVIAAMGCGWWVRERHWNSAVQVERRNQLVERENREAQEVRNVELQRELGRLSPST